MKLSEAIRLGSMIRQQAFGVYSISGKSCALGAAIEAAGINVEDVTQTFPILLKEGFNCPVCFDDSRPMYHLVTHLNDGHEWARESIADWIESLEAKEQENEKKEELQEVSQ